MPLHRRASPRLTRKRKWMILMTMCLFNKDVVKQCFKCMRHLPLDDFYRHPKMADGRLGKCKECTKSDVAHNRLVKIEYYQAYNRDRFQNDPESRARQLAQMKAWAKANPDKRSKKNWQSRNPEKRQCHNDLNNAVRDGVVLKPTACSSCGITDVKIHGHHPDYTQPLAVIWLCAPCHSRQHRLEREQLRQATLAQQAVVIG